MNKTAYYSQVLDWLQETNRLIPREHIDTHAERVDDEELSELMDVEDADYEDDTSNDAILED